MTTLKPVTTTDTPPSGGTRPELARLVKGTSVAGDRCSHQPRLPDHPDDQSQPVLDSQTNTSELHCGVVAHIATVTGELKAQDPAVSKLLTDGPAAADAPRALLDRFQPSLGRSC